MEENQTHVFAIFAPVDGVEGRKVDADVLVEGFVVVCFGGILALAAGRAELVFLEAGVAWICERGGQVNERRGRW